MKKSFLKRAMAAAIAVPVALTQTVFCLAFAEETHTLTVDTFMNVPTDGDSAVLVSDDGTTRVWEQKSLWNVTMYNALNSLAGNTYVLDVEALAAELNEYSDDEDAAKLKEMLLSGAATVTVNSDDVTLTIEGDFRGRSCQAKVVANTANLAKDTEVTFDVEVIDYELTEKDEARVDKLIGKSKDVTYSGTPEEIYAQAKAEAEAFDKVPDRFEDEADKVLDKAPATLKEALQNSKTAKLLTKAIEQVAEKSEGKVAVDVTIDDLQAVLDSVVNVTVSASYADQAGSATVTGTLTDEADVEELRTYFEAIEAEKDYEIVDFSVVKVVDASAEGSFELYESAEGSAELNIKRVITYTVKEVEPTKPTDPTEPEGPTTPTDPEGPTTPTDPEGPTTPTDPEGPTTPTDPEGPTTPTDPEGPTTPTDPVEPPTDDPGLVDDVVVVGDGLNYFFSHDETPLTAEELVESAVLVVGEEEYDVMSLISFGLDANGPIEGLTPAMVFEEMGAAYTANALYVYYTAVGAEPVLVKNADVNIFVGVKGDADLDGDVNAIDAAKVLGYAAEKGANGEATLYSADDQGLETLAYFLADVDGMSRNCGEDGSDLNALDAAGILAFAADKGANPGKSAATIWDEILGVTA